MYEQFGAVVQGNSVTWKLFIPDNTRDPSQYTRGSSPSIRSIRVRGDFQSELGSDPWSLDGALPMEQTPHPNGWLYTVEVPHLDDGFYQYKYFVEFQNDTTRWCTDPCSRYDGSDSQNSAFVIGGNDMKVRPLRTGLRSRIS